MANEIKFTKEHEWVSLEGNTAAIGITDFAQHALGDIVFADLPGTGLTLNVGDSFGSVESVKAVSDIFSPVSGEVVEVNTAVADTPELLNTEPEVQWMIKVALDDPSQLDGLMDRAAYEEFCAKEG